MNRSKNLLVLSYPKLSMAYSLPVRYKAYVPHKKSVVHWKWFHVKTSWPIWTNGLRRRKDQTIKKSKSFKAHLHFIRISDFGCELIPLCSHPNLRKSYPNVRIRIWCIRMFSFYPNVRIQTKSSRLWSANQNMVLRNNRLWLLMIVDFVRLVFSVSDSEFAICYANCEDRNPN